MKRRLKRNLKIIKFHPKVQTLGVLITKKIASLLNGRDSERNQRVYLTRIEEVERKKDFFSSEQLSFVMGVIVNYPIFRSFLGCKLHETTLLRLPPVKGTDTSNVIDTRGWFVELDHDCHTQLFTLHPD